MRSVIDLCNLDNPWEFSHMMNMCPRVPLTLQSMTMLNLEDSPLTDSYDAINHHNGAAPQ